MPLRLEKVADGLDELLEIPQVVLQDFVNKTMIDFEIFMNEDISKTDHRCQLCRKPGGQQLLFGKDLSDLTVLGRCFKTKIRDDVITDIEDRLNGDLQIALGASDEKWIL